MFLDDPSILLLAPPPFPLPSRGRLLPLAPPPLPFSPWICPSRGVLLAPFPPRAYFCSPLSFSPSRLILFCVLFRVDVVGAKRDRDPKSLAESGIAPGSDFHPRERHFYVLSFLSLRVRLSLPRARSSLRGETCTVPNSCLACFTRPLSRQSVSSSSRYGFHELSAVSRHHPSVPPVRNSTQARARAPSLSACSPPLPFSPSPLCITRSPSPFLVRLSGVKPQRDFTSSSSSKFS